MLAHWYPDGCQCEGQTLNAGLIRDYARPGAHPACGEALSALGLHPELLRRIGARGLRTLPGQTLAGYQLADASKVLAIAPSSGVDDVEMRLEDADRHTFSDYALPMVIA